MPCYNRWRYSEFREKYRTQGRAWYQRNRSKVKADSKAYAHANRERVRQWKRAYKAKNREHFKEYNRRNWLRRKYGLTLPEYDSLLAAQDNVCAICLRGDFHGETPHIDHDHEKTGRTSVRGVLCTHCNKLIGHGYEDPELLERAAEYIRRHSRLRLVFSVVA